MNAAAWKNIHLGLLFVWAAAIPGAFVFGWWESVPFVAMASIYANMATHWSAWQSSRAEESE